MGTAPDPPIASVLRRVRDSAPSAAANGLNLSGVAQA